MLFPACYSQHHSGLTSSAPSVLQADQQGIYMRTHQAQSKMKEESRKNQTYKCTHIHVHKYSCVPAYTCVCIHINVHTHLHTTHTHTHPFTPAQNESPYICVYIHIYIYVHLHTPHKHTYKRLKRMTFPWTLVKHNVFQNSVNVYEVSMVFAYIYGMYSVSCAGGMWCVPLYCMSACIYLMWYMYVSLWCVCVMYIYGMHM